MSQQLENVKMKCNENEYVKMKKKVIYEKCPCLLI